MSVFDLTSVFTEHVYKVSLRQFFLSEYFGFSLSVSSTSALYSFTRLSPMPYSLNNRHHRYIKHKKEYLELILSLSSCVCDVVLN